MWDLFRRRKAIPHLEFEMWGTLFLMLSLILLPQGIAKAQAGSSKAGGESAASRRADVAFRAGYAAVQAGKLEEARKDFTEAVSLAPKIAVAHESLGVTLALLKRPEQAIPELAIATKLEPGNRLYIGTLVQAHEELGVSLAGLGKTVEAESHFRAAISILPAIDVDHPDVRDEESFVPAKAKLQDELGSVLAQQKRWPEAEVAFREALRLNPEIGAGPHMHLGVVLVEKKELQPGLAELGKAVQLAPNNAVAQFQLGRGLAGAGNDEEAIPHLEEALKLSPNLPGGVLELAMAVQREGRQEESIPLFQRSIEAEPHNASALTNLGLALTQTGRAKEAVPFFERALAETPNDPVVHEDMGVAELQQSHFDEAIAQFEKARELDAENPQLHYDLGLAYKLKDRMDDAVRELTKAVRLGPMLPDPPYTLGILYMQLGRQEEAVTQLRASLALRPANGDGWAVLGSVLKQLDRRDEAEAALRKAVELLPNQPGAHITLAAVLAEEGKTQQAAAERKVAADLSRTAVNRQRAQLSTNAGNQSLQRGEIAEAVGRYLEAIAADPGYAEAHSQLAVAYERQGRAEDAKAERVKAAAIEKGDTSQP